MSDRLKLVIFDVDGTLVDSQAAIVGAMTGAFAAVGAPLPERQVLLSIVGLSLDRAMADNRPPLDTETATLIRWNASYAVELCRRATERVFAAAGAKATHDTSPLQRWHRDINTACHHAIVDYDGLLEIRGRTALGLPTGPGS